MGCSARRAPQPPLSASIFTAEAEYRQSAQQAVFDPRLGGFVVFGALAQAGLIERSKGDLALTPRGVFFSDSVVATLAEERGPTRSGAGIHTLEALAAPTRLAEHDYGGMG